MKAADMMNEFRWFGWRASFLRSGRVAKDWSCFGEGELLEGFVGVRKAEEGGLVAGLSW